MQDKREKPKKRQRGFSALKRQKKLAPRWGQKKISRDFAFSGIYEPEGEPTTGRAVSKPVRLEQLWCEEGVLFRQGVCHI